VFPAQDERRAHGDAAGLADLQLDARMRPDVGPATRKITDFVGVSENVLGELAAQLMTSIDLAPIEAQPLLAQEFREPRHADYQATRYGDGHYHQS